MGIAEIIGAICLICLAGLCGYALGMLEKRYREEDYDEDEWEE